MSALTHDPAHSPVNAYETQIFFRHPRLINLWLSLLSNNKPAWVVASVEQQGAAMQEIARNTQLASDRTRDASHSVTAVSEGTSATMQSAEAVKAAAGSLGIQATQLWQQVDGFMARIRAA
jgi:hypothetical protein